MPQSHTPSKICFTGSPDAPALLSAGKDSVQSSTSGQLVSALAVDGNTSSAYGSCATTLSQGAQYWQVDLGDTYQIANVTVINRYCVFASSNSTPVLASVLCLMFVLLSDQQ